MGAAFSINGIAPEENGLLEARVKGAHLIAGLRTLIDEDVLKVEDLGGYPRQYQVLVTARTWEQVIGNRDGVFGWSDASLIVTIEAPPTRVRNVSISRVERAPASMLPRVA